VRCQGQGGMKVLEYIITIPKRNPLPSVRVIPSSAIGPSAAKHKIPIPMSTRNDMALAFKVSSLSIFFFSSIFSFSLFFLSSFQGYTAVMGRRNTSGMSLAQGHPTRLTRILALTAIQRAQDGGPQRSCIFGSLFHRDEIFQMRVAMIPANWSLGGTAHH